MRVLKPILFFVLPIILFVLALLIICFGGLEDKSIILPATELAFEDFVIGGSFRDCYKNASINPAYQGLKEKSDGLLNYAEFLSMEVPNYDNPDELITLLMGEIKSYKDSIYSIKYFAYNDDAIFGMYQAKYGAINPTEFTYDMEDYHHTDSSRTWMFENGSIFIVKREREPISIVSTLSHHNDGVIVQYSDNTISPIAEKYEEMLSERKDSIKQAQREQEQLQKELEEQEKANLKNVKQKEIVDKVRF